MVFDDTARGLADFVGFLASTDDDDVLDWLRLPDAEAWFADRFGAEIGAALHAEYRADVGAGSLQEVAGELSRRTLRGTPLGVDGQMSPCSTEVTGYQAQALRCMRAPIALFTVDLGGYRLSSFVHVRGAWRWLGKLRAASNFPTPPPRTLAAAGYGDTTADLERFVVDLLGHLDELAHGADADAFHAEAARLARAIVPAEAAGEVAGALAALVAGGCLGATAGRDGAVTWLCHEGPGTRSAPAAWEHVGHAWRVAGSRNEGQFA